MEISTKMHLLELSTMIHVVRKQIKYILVNERPRDISLARLLDLISRVSVCYYFFRDEKNPLDFSNNMTRVINQQNFQKSSEFGQSDVPSNTLLLISHCVSQQ